MNRADPFGPADATTRAPEQAYAAPMRALTGRLPSLLAVLLLALAGCGAAQNLASPDLAVDAAIGPDLLPPGCSGKSGDPTGADFFSDDGIHGIVRTPGGYDNTAKAPLLMAYSPAGADAALNERFTGLTADALPRGYLVTYVDNVQPTSVDAIAAAGRVMNWVMDSYCVDERRVYVTGHSNGGSITEVVGMKQWTPVAAIAPSAAGVNARTAMSIGCPSTPLPVMEIHSSGDQLFPLGKGFGAQVAAFWASCDQCDPTPSDPDADNCVVYAKCAGDVEVRYCEGGAAHGHWPGLNTQMLDFFDRFRLKRRAASGEDRASASAVLPGRGALAQEGVHALGGVLEHEVLGHHPTGQGVGVGQLEVDLAIEGALAGADDGGRTTGDDGGVVGDGLIELGGRHDLVAQAAGQRRGGVDELAGEQHLHGVLAGDVAGHAHHRRRAEHPDVDAGQGEARLGRGHRQVAHRHQLAARGGGDAVDAGDDRLGHLGEGHHHAAAGVEEGALPRGVAGVSAHLLEVVAGGEATPGGAQHHRPHRRIAGVGRALVLEGGAQRSRPRVEALAAVAGERDDAVGLLGAQHQRRGGEVGGGDVGHGSWR
jgi:polyhydroxybutyrate depolymerase